MNSKDFECFENSGLFDHNELFQISVVSEIVEEFKIIFERLESKENKINELEISITPLMILETRKNHAEIDYITIFNENGKLVTSQNRPKIFFKKYGEIFEPITEALKEINYRLINTSLDFILTSEVLKVKNDETLEQSVMNTLLSDELRKKIEVALLSDSLMNNTKTAKRKTKV